MQSWVYERILQSKILFHQRCRKLYVKSGRPTNPNRYCLSGEEHFEAYKEMFGAENVEWTSRDTLSSADRLRIQDWAYPPTDELY